MNYSMTAVTFPRDVRLRVLAHRAEAHDFPSWERAYREAIVDDLRRSVDDGAAAVVYDIGAEEGESTALAASIVGPRNVHAFESSPAYWPNIRAVWEANFDERPGGCWCGFVAAERRGQTLYDSNRIQSRLWPSSSERAITLRGAFTVVHERPDLPATTLDWYAERAPEPDVITMDVEGAEGLVLEGAERLLRTRRPTVYLALHREEMLGAYGWTRARVFDLAKANGYRLDRIAEEKHEEHWRLRPEERV